MTAPIPAGGDGQAAWMDQVRAAFEQRLTEPDLSPLDLDVEALIDLIDRGREQLDNPHSLTRATAEGIAGAVYELIAMSLVRGKEAELPDLLPQLMFFAIRPYLGVEAALSVFHGLGLERPLAEGRRDP